jgi:hypothetical protein
VALATPQGSTGGFEFPQIDSVEDATKAMAAFGAGVADGGVADGELTPMEAAELSKVVDGYTRAVETTEAAQLVAARTSTKEIGTQARI